MSGTLIDNPGTAWTANEVSSVLTTDLAVGQGVGSPNGGIGTLNAGAQKLANRTAYLRGQILAETARAQGAEALLASLVHLAAETARAEGAEAALTPLADFVGWLGTPGYITIPSPWSPSGKFIIQWGQNVVGSSTFVAFPIVFPVACLMVLVSEGGANAGVQGSGTVTAHAVGNFAGNGYYGWANISEGTTWGFASGGLTQNYIAVGC